MRFNPIIFAAAIATLFLIFAPVAVCRADAAQAKAQFDIAVTHMKNREYTMALSAFEDSYRIKKVGVVLFNIAMCQHALHRYIDAYRTYQRLLNDEAGPVDAETADKVKQALANLSKHIGTVILSGWHDGTTVTIDGEPQTINQTDPTLRMTPGLHILAAHRNGYQSKQVTIDAVANKTIGVDVALHPEPTRLKVTCLQGETVHINGEALGPCPFSASVPPGQMTVTVEKKGAPLWTQTIKTTPGGSFVLTPPKPIRPTPVTATPAALPERPWLMIAGMTSSFLGLAGIGTGIGFGAIRYRRWKEVRTLLEQTNDAAGTNRPQYDTLYPNAQNKERAYLNDEPGYRAGMITGVALGSALTLTGAALLILHHKNQPRESPPVHLSSMGLSIRF